MVRLPLLLAVFWPTVASAQQSAVYDIYFGGTKSGETIESETSDGKFSSKMTLKIGGITVTSNLEAVIKNDMLVEVHLQATQSGTTTKIDWQDGKYSVVSGGKEAVKDKAYKPHLKVAFTAFHPSINRLLWKGLNGMPKKTKALWVDSLAELDVEFQGKSQTVKTAAGQVAAEFWSADVGGTKIIYAFSQEGKPLGVDVPSQKIAWVLRGYDGVFVDPLTAYPELSQPSYKVKTERRVRMKARDGVSLMADVSRPDAEGKFPTVLIRTPYGRGASLSAEEWLVSRGYVVVSQDVRGRGGSDGEWDPLVNERKDGHDTLEWIVQQPWSDGKIGMIGGSYLGYVQWAAATSEHPALKCIIPQVSPPQPDSNFPWDHGSFMLLSDLWWCRIVKDRLSGTGNAFASLTKLDALKTLPLTKVDDVYFGEDIPFFDKWLKRPTLKDWGDVFTTQDVSRVTIPALHVSGIWDGDGIGTAIHWGARGGTRPQDLLIFGPWTHLFNTSHKFGDQEYGEHGILELNSVYLRFFDTHLKGRSASLDSIPRVQFFVTGSNKWVFGPSWPLPTSKPITWNMSAGGGLGRSVLSSGKDSYSYDPNNPAFKATKIDINVTGETTVLPAEKHGNASVTYRTEKFGADTTLAGPIRVEMYVSSTARDATFQATVLDVGPDGVQRMIGLPGNRRATYRDGKLVPLVPGKPVKIMIEPWWFAHQFKKGHRMAILISSDAYPRFSRNPGTGELDWKATRLIKAKHTVWTGSKYPSKVSLWKLPN